MARQAAARVQREASGDVGADQLMDIMYFLCVWVMEIWSSGGRRPFRAGLGLLAAEAVFV